MAKARMGYRSPEEFLAMWRRQTRGLRRWMVDNFDHAIVDCPPTLALQVKALLPSAHGYVTPCIPDRLSVRGAAWMIDQLRRRGYKIEGVGTLWTVFRVENAIHKAVRDRTPPWDEQVDRLPRPFETVIPNATAIVRAFEPGGSPRCFNDKYTLEFASRYRAVAREMLARSKHFSGD